MVEMSKLDKAEKTINDLLAKDIALLKKSGKFFLGLLIQGVILAFLTWSLSSIYKYLGFEHTLIVCFAILIMTLTRNRI